MAILIRKVIKEPTNRWSSNIEEWLIAGRFELSIHDSDKERCSFFADDKKLHISLIPKILKDMKLLEQSDINFFPSIDTCGISTPQSRRDEVFKLIEHYLLDQKILKDMKLLEQSGIIFFPVIDTSEMIVAQSRRNEIFKLIEDYLLDPKNVAVLESYPEK